MRRTILIALPALLIAGLVPSAVVVSSVQAVNGTGEYGVWSVGATSKTGNVFLGSPGSGFLDPAAAWTSTASTVTFPSGSTSWLGPTTPFGAYFGSSQNKGYINQQIALNVERGETVYTFADITPVGTWGFALGDIDVDQVRIEAEDALGNAIALGDWYESSFDYCDVSPRPSSCSSGVQGGLPVWNAATQTLVGRGKDTVGAAAWFMPTTPVKKLTMTFSRPSGTGAPSYQTWMAVDEVPTPTPTPTPTTTSATPTPTTTSATPTPTTTSATPTPTTTSATPTPTTTSATPTPTTTSATPTPTTTSATPTPTTTSATPTPTTTSATPTPTTTSATPTPTTTSATPTPTPTPTPAPEPQKPTEPIELPATIDNPGTTTIIDEPIVTNGGQTVTVTVTCVPLVYGRGAAVPRGSYELCTVRKFRKTGVVTVTTYGNPLQLTVTLKAPAVEGYTAYKRTKIYAVR